MQENHFTDFVGNPMLNIQAFLEASHFPWDFDEATLGRWYDDGETEDLSSIAFHVHLALPPVADSFEDAYTFFNVNELAPFFENLFPNHFLSVDGYWESHDHVDRVVIAEFSGSFDEWERRLASFLGRRK